MSENKIIVSRSSFDFDSHKTIYGAIAGASYQYDDEIKVIITKLIHYFNGDDTCGLSLEKGLMIIGGLGSGKTTLMENIRKYLGYTMSPNVFRMAESRDICKEFAKDGFGGIEKFGMNPTVNSAGIVMPQPYHLCIDDFGIEAEYSKHYGTETNPVAEVLLDRYKIMKSFSKATHIITNLTADNQKGRYSDRIVDRFKEMFNIITLKSKSRR